MCGGGRVFHPVQCPMAAYIEPIDTSVQCLSWSAGPEPVLGGGAPISAPVCVTCIMKGSIVSIRVTRVAISAQIALHPASLLGLIYESSCVISIWLSLCSALLHTDTRVVFSKFIYLSCELCLSLSQACYTQSIMIRHTG